MKKLLTMVVLWLVPLPARAQPELGIAFKGGPNAATLAEDNRVNRYGFSGGLAGHLQWPLAGQFSLAGQVDLLYSPRGAETIAAGEYLGKTRRRYFDVVVAARPDVRLGPVSVYLLLGGSLNFLFSANREDASGVSQDITDGLNRTDLALVVGAGIGLHLPRQGEGPLRFGTIFLEGRRDHGLLDSDPSGGFKNRTSSLMLGLSFALGSGTAAVSPPGSPATPSDPPSPATVGIPAGLID